MAVRFTSREIRSRYEKVARWYDLMEAAPELLGLRRLRRRLIERASSPHPPSRAGTRRVPGETLEVAAGTGKNFRYYPRGSRLVAVDLTPSMLKIARRRARKLGLDARLLVMDSEALAFRDHRFDTVVSSLTLCTFPDPVAALREMARVCRPDGRILLLEHGRSDRERLGRWQDRRADRHAKAAGCNWNREPLDLVRQAGLRVLSAERTFFGVFHLIEAKPPEAHA